MRKIVIALVMLSAGCRSASSDLGSLPDPGWLPAESAAESGLQACPEDVLSGIKGLDRTLDWRHSVADGISLCVPASWRGGGVRGQWRAEGVQFTIRDGIGPLRIVPRRSGDPRRGVIRTEVSGTRAEFYYIDPRIAYKSDSLLAVQNGRPMPVRRSGYRTTGAWPAMGVGMMGTAANMNGVRLLQQVFMTVRFVPIVGAPSP